MCDEQSCVRPGAVGCINYSECLLRTTETGGFEGGMIMLTFTPLNGLTPVVEMFLGEMGE